MGLALNVDVGSDQYQYSVMLMGSNVIHVEAKAGSPGNFSKQHLQFYEYLQSHYCTFSYEPLLIKFITGNVQCCENHKQNVITINCQEDIDQFHQWWKSPAIQTKFSSNDTNCQCENLTEDFLLRSIMVLATSLHEIQRGGIQCSLFLLRYINSSITYFGYTF